MSQGEIFGPEVVQHAKDSQAVPQGVTPFDAEKAGDFSGRVDSGDICDERGQRGISEDEGGFEEWGLSSTITKIRLGGIGNARMLYCCKSNYPSYRVCFDCTNVTSP